MMTQTKSLAALAINLPPTLTLTVTREQFIELAIANRGSPEFVVINKPHILTPRASQNREQLCLIPYPPQTQENPNRDVQLEHTTTGELIVNPPTGGETGIINLEISGQIWLWNCQTRLGVAFSSSTGFDLQNRAIRSPDASWVRQERWDALTPEQKAGFAPISPDFVVELCSETDRMKMLQDKMKEYMKNQVRLGWLLNQQNRKVEIYRLNREVQVLDNPKTLSGEDILPGFVLDLAEVLA